MRNLPRIVITLILLPLLSIGQHFRQIDKIVASDRDTSDQFSVSVDIDGDFAISGAYKNSFDSNGSNYMIASGAAYTYQFINGAWVQTQKLTASDRSFADHFGVAVAIDGNFAVVGAKQDRDSVGAGGQLIMGAGSVYIFQRNASGVWTEIQKIVAPDRSMIDYFGACVDIDNTTIIVSADNASSPSTQPNSPNAGAVYVFEKNGSGTWVFTQRIYAPDPDPFDRFGRNLSVSGSTLVVGAIGESEDALGTNTISSAGAAYVFEKQGTTWSQTQKLVALHRNLYGQFGMSVSTIGSDILIGAPKDELDSTGLNPISSAGAAYFFTKIGSTWSVSQKVVAEDRANLNLFGNAVAFTDSFAIVASNSPTDSLGNNPLNHAGAGYIFHKQATTWSQLQKVVTYDREPGDFFSNPCAISGTTIMLSAISEDEDQNGQNTMPWAGSAYIFKPCYDSDTIYADTSCISYVSPSELYTWSNTGTYNDTIRNQEGCDSLITIHLVIQSASVPLQLDTVLNQNPSCYRSMDGQIQVGITGGAMPYIIKWNNGDSVTSLSNLDTGFYKIVVVDKFGCSDSLYFNLSEPDSISIGLVNLNHITCHGQNDGDLGISVTGGFAPYSISWSNGDTTRDINDLSVGNYTVTVTDSFGCSSSKTYTINEPDSLTLTLTNLRNISCFGDNDGTVSILANGGTAPYSFSWNRGQSTSRIDLLGKGSYDVTITDSKGCTVRGTYQITEPDPLLISYSENQSPSCGKENGEVTLNIQGGVKPYNVIWNNGDMGRSLTDVSEGFYKATITDSAGCVKDFDIQLKDGYKNKLYFANSFSPDGDGINDVYEILGQSECFTQARLEIFNRWGERIFATNKPFEEFWNGLVETKKSTKIDIYTFYFTSDEYSDSGYIQILH